MSEAILRNDAGGIVTIAPLDLVFRFLKHECPDGVYTVTKEPDTHAIFRRFEGVVYPLAGRVEAEPRGEQ